MGRIILALVVSAMMSGCVLLTTVSGVAGAAVDGLFYMFQGAEESLSISMRSTLVAVQRGLKKSGLHASVLEPVEDGYMIAFGNENLDGEIALEKETERLTTLVIKVKSNAMRQDSIERALVVTIREQSKTVRNSDRFDFRRHRDIYENKDATSKKVGWFLPGTMLDVTEVPNSDWLKIKMPSGAHGFLKGDLAAADNK